VNTKTLLLCSLSRALHDTEAALDWLWDTLQWRIQEIAPDMLINGGAEQGDRDATKIAHALGIGCYEYRTDGWIYVPDRVGMLCRMSRWWDAGGSVYPLERNRFMVSRCVQARESGWNVRVLGLVAPWSKTHGTEHTLAQARHAGFGEQEVSRVECPAEYGRPADAG
jgi:hypothetical protein